MGKRKLILLNKDSSVKQSKKSIATLIARGTLYDAKWVLIPIVNTSATYVAVSVDTILSISFRTIDIKFLMQSMSSCDDIINPTAGLKYHSVYDYYGTTMTVDTWEEFYNAIYNVLAFRYLYELGGHSESTDGLWFMNVQALEITAWKSRTEPPVEHLKIDPSTVKNVPFDYTILDNVVDAIRNRFGMYNGDKGWDANIVIEKGPNGDVWRETHEPILLSNSVKYVCVYNHLATSFCVLDLEEYDAALRMEVCHITLAPIQFIDHTDSLKEDKPIDFLPITTYHDLPTYEFLDHEYGITSGEEIYFYYQALIPNIFPYSIFMADDIICALDHIYYFLKVYHEGIKALAAQLMFDDMELDRIDELEDWTTVFFEAVCDLGGINNPTDDDCFKIMTDAFQDHLPDIKEICYLLKLQEKPF